MVSQFIFNHRKKMSTKIIFVLFGLFAYACAIKESSLTIWDETSTGKLRAEATLTIEKVDGQNHGKISNVKLIERENVTPEKIFRPFKWILEEPLKDITFDFTYDTEGLYTISSLNDDRESVKRLTRSLVQAIAHGKYLERLNARNEQLEEKKKQLETVFGRCDIKNIKKVQEGNDIVITFDIDKDKCVDRQKALIPEPKQNDNVCAKFVLGDGKELKEISCNLQYEQNGVNHNVGCQLVNLN